MRLFKKKLEKFIDINPDHPDIKETNEKLVAIFPNSNIVFKLERSHDYKIHCKYIGIYVDDLLMSVQKVETFNWNMTWIDVISKLEYLKSHLDFPEIYSGKLILPIKNK